MLFRNRLFSMIAALFLVFALVSPSAAVACTGSGRLYDGQKSPAASIRHEDGTAGRTGGTAAGERGSGRELKRGPERESGNQSGQKHETKTDPAKRLPVLSTEPAAGASGVRPDTAIRIVFDPASKMFKHISKQLQKNHFFVLLNGQKAEAVYDGKNTVEVKPGLLQRYTSYTVHFCLRPYNFLTRAIDAVNRKLGLRWDKKTYEFAFKTGSALHEPRHAEFALSSNRAKVTEGAVLGVTFTDDYGQPGYGATGKVTLVESGQKPGSAKAAPSEFTVAENSDGTAEVVISDTEAEKVTVTVEVYGPYPEDAAKFSGEVDFRPGPAAKVSLSCDKKRVVVGQKAAVSGTAEDAYGNPVEDGTQVIAGASAGQVSGASTSGGAFSLEFTAPTKKQPVTVTAEVDGCRASLDVPVIADVPAKVTVTPEKDKAMAGSPVRVGILVEDRYGNPVEDGTVVAVTAEGGSASPSEVTTKEGAASVEVTSSQAGDVTVTASAQNGVTGSAAVSFVPAVVPLTARVIGGTAFCSSSMSSSVAVKPDGSAITWRWDSRSKKLITCTWLTGAEDVAAGLSHVLALKTDGTVWAWGDNQYGQLGSWGGNQYYNTVQVKGLTNVVAVAAGYYHSLAVKSDGTVWAWGFNNCGQLGDGTTTNRYTPVQVKGLTDVVSVAGGFQFSLALKRDGTVWAWGDSSCGQLGNGAFGNGARSATPVQVKGLTDVVAIAAGGKHALALKSDGTVWAWGDNMVGQVGSGNTLQRTPVQVNGLTGVVAIAAGSYHSLALKSDGTVWAWGRNQYGAVGVDSYAFKFETPVQAKGLNDVVAIAAGYDTSYAIKSDGTVWAWGWNYNGQLGFDIGTSYYSESRYYVPTQVVIK